MSAHDTVPALVLAALLLVAGTGVGAAAGTSAGADGAQHANYSMHVHTSLGPDGMTVSAAYEGEGSATLTVTGVGGEYSGAGSWQVDGEQSIHLPAPEEPDGIRVVLEAPNASVERTIEYGTYHVDCGPISTERRVPTSITYAWTVESDGETRSDSYEVELPVRDVECPPLPERPEFDYEDVALEDYHDRVNERLAQAREEMEERRSAVPDPESGEAADWAHDEAHEAHDDAHETVRDGIRDANDTGHEAYGDASDEADERVSDGSEPGFAALATVLATLGHAEDDASHARNETERDAEVAGNALESFVERVLGDAEERAEQGRDDANRAGEHVDDACESDNDRDDDADRDRADGSADASVTVGADASGTASTQDDGSTSASVDGDATANASAEASAGNCSVGSSVDGGGSVSGDVALGDD